MQTLEGWLVEITSAISKAKALAIETGEDVQFEFNGPTVVVSADSDEAERYQWWDSEMKRRAKEWRESPEGIRSAKLDMLRAAEEKARRARVLAEEEGEEVKFTIRPGLEDEYAAYVEKNSHDGYSHVVITFTERWGWRMEKKLQYDWYKIENVAEKACSEADIEGITGFMYGCAVSALSYFWIHGDALRAWHNAQYITDPVKLAEANAKGGTVNPAILTIGD